MKRNPFLTSFALRKILIWSPIMDETLLLSESQIAISPVFLSCFCVKGRGLFQNTTNHIHFTLFSGHMLAVPRQKSDACKHSFGHQIIVLICKTQFSNMLLWNEEVVSWLEDGVGLYFCGNRLRIQKNKWVGVRNTEGSPFQDNWNTDRITKIRNHREA